MPDFHHPLVGRAVVYRNTRLPDRPPEQGVVTSVNRAAGIVFVRYGSDTGSKATTADHLTFLDGSKVEVER